MSYKAGEHFWTHAQLQDSHEDLVQEWVRENSRVGDIVTVEASEEGVKMIIERGGPYPRGKQLGDVLA